jgi:hypothetical protein
VPLVLIASAGSGLLATRGVVWADRSDAAPATRVVVAAVVVAAFAVVWLAAAGLVGGLAIAACAAIAIGTVKP